MVDEVESSWLDPEELGEPVDSDTIEQELPDGGKVITTAFPPQSREAFEGLLFLGYLQREVKIPFHKFVIRTLRTGEKIEIGQIVSEYEDTLAYGKAYQTAVVAAALVEVDGREIVPASKTISVIRQKYNYLFENWYDFVIHILFKHYQELETEQFEVLKELGVFED